MSRPVEWESFLRIGRIAAHARLLWFGEGPHKDLLDVRCVSANEEECSDSRNVWGASGVWGSQKAAELLQVADTGPGPPFDREYWFQVGTSSDGRLI